MIIGNWREVLKKAWSIKFMLLSAVFSGLEAALPYLDNFAPKGLMAFLSLAAVSGGLISRFIQQNGIKS